MQRANPVLCMLARFTRCPECDSDSVEQDIVGGVVPVSRCAQCGCVSEVMAGVDDEEFAHVPV